MKKPNRNSIVAALLAVSLALTGSIRPTLADGFPGPHENTHSRLVISTNTLDQLLLAGNTDIIREMNTVLRARDQVALVRTALLPSISLNLGMAFSNPPQFLLSMASCLVPFLFPAKWFDLDASEKTYASEVQGLHAAKLNAYAVAYSLLLQVSGEEKYLVLMKERFASLNDYVNSLNMQFQLGLIREADAIRGQIELDRAKNDLSKTQEMIDGERAALRKMLALDISQEFDIVLPEVTESPLEARTLESDLDLVLKRAPERRQLELASDAARANVKSAEWAFLSGCSGGSGGVGSANAAPSPVRFSSSFSIDFGFGYFPRVRLAKRNVQDIELRKEDLKLELGRNLEATRASIRETKVQIGNLQQEAELAQRLLDQQTQLFAVGHSSVKDMLDAYSSIAASKIELQTANLALAGHRVTLKRMALEDKYLQILIDSRRQLETR